VYRHEIHESGKRLRLWVRRKRGNRKLVCAGCGRKSEDYHDFSEREVRDLPWSFLLTTVVIEVHRVKCPDCGVKVERVPLLPSKAAFSQRFEYVVGQACEGASTRQVARRFGLAESTVRAIDLRYLVRWSACRTKPAVKHLGVDEIYLGKRQKFITLVSNLETAEPLWSGQDRK
jgi:transposase